MSAPVAPVDLQQQLIDLIHQKTNESDDLEKNAEKLRADLIKAGREERLLLDQQRNAISFAKIRKAKLIAAKEARLALLESFEDRVELLKLVQKSALERIKNLQEPNPAPTLTVLAELTDEQVINDDVTRKLELAKKAVAQEKVEVANANRKVQEAESLEETALLELKSKVEKAQEATDFAAKAELSHGEKIISEFNEHNKALEVIYNQILKQYGYVILEDWGAINQLLTKQNQVFDKYITFFDRTTNQIIQQTLPSLIEGIISADFMNRHDTFIGELQEAVANPPEFFYTTQHARRANQKAVIRQFETDIAGLLQALITAPPPVNQRQAKINLVTEISSALRNEIVTWTQAAQERQSIANEKKSLAEVMQMELKNNVEQLKKALDLAIAEEKTQNEKFTEATNLYLQRNTIAQGLDSTKRNLAFNKAQQSKAFLEQQLQGMEALLTQTTEYLKNIEKEVKLAQVEVEEVKDLRIAKQKELIELQTDIENAASAKSATPEDKGDARNQELQVLMPLENEYDEANRRDVNVAHFTDATITFLQNKILANEAELQQIKSAEMSTKALAKLKETEIARLMAAPWLTDAAKARIQTLTAWVTAHNTAEEKLKAKAEDAQARLEDAESEIKKAQIKKYGLTADELYHLNVDAVLKEKLDILQQIRAVENQTPSQPNKVQELQLKLEEKEAEIFKIKKKIFLLSRDQDQGRYDLLKVRMLINSAARMRYLVDNNESSEKEVLLENLNNVLLEPLSTINPTAVGSAAALDPVAVAAPFDITNLETSLAVLTPSQIKAAEAAIGVELAAKTAQMANFVTVRKGQIVTETTTLSVANDDAVVGAAAQALAVSLGELRNLEKVEAKTKASIQAVDVIKKIQPSTETWKEEITFFKNVIKTLLAKEWPEATNRLTKTIPLGNGFSLEITGDDIVLAKEAPPIFKKFAADLESISSTESATRIVTTQEEPLEHKEYFNFLSDLQDAIARKDPILDAERTKLIAEASVIDLPEETKEFAGSNLKNVTDEGYTFYKIRSGIFRIHGDSQRIDILGEDKIFHTAVSQFQLNEFLEKCHEPIVFEKINRNAYLEYPSDAKSIDIGGDFFLKNTVINNDQDRTDFLNADCFLLATQKFKLIKETGIKHNREKFLNKARFARVKFETDFFLDPAVQPVGANFVKCYFDNVDFRQLTPKTLRSLIFQDCKFGKDCLFPVGFKFGDQFRSSEKDHVSGKITIKNAKPPKDVPAIEIPDDKIHVIEVSKFASLSRDLPRA